MGEFRHVLASTLTQGLDPIAVKETLYQGTTYLGIGRVRDFLEAANEIMQQQGISLPLAPQRQTDATSRFDKGLAKQVALFGEDMAKRQTSGPAGAPSIAGWPIIALATTIPAQG